MWGLIDTIVPMGDHLIRLALALAHSCVLLGHTRVFQTRMLYDGYVLY